MRMRYEQAEWSFIFNSIIEILIKLKIHFYNFNVSANEWKSNENKSIERFAQNIKWEIKLKKSFNFNSMTEKRRSEQSFEWKFNGKRNEWIKEFFIDEMIMSPQN